MVAGLVGLVAIEILSNHIHSEWILVWINEQNTKRWMKKHTFHA